MVRIQPSVSLVYCYWLVRIDTIRLEAFEYGFMAAARHAACVKICRAHGGSGRSTSGLKLANHDVLIVLAGDLLLARHVRTCSSAVKSNCWKVR